MTRRRDRGPKIAASTYMPAELRRLQRALELAHLSGLPPTPPGIMAGGGGRVGPSSHAPTDAPEGRRARRILEAALKRVAREAERLERELVGAPAAARGGWRCTSCGRFGRGSARFCDGCGTARP